MYGARANACATRETSGKIPLAAFTTNAESHPDAEDFAKRTSSTATITAGEQGALVDRY